MKSFKMSDQAVGCFMMALQKCMVEGLDFRELVANFSLVVENNQVFVENPPTFQIDFSKMNLDQE